MYRFCNLLYNSKIGSYNDDIREVVIENSNTTLIFDFLYGTALRNADIYYNNRLPEASSLEIKIVNVSISENAAEIQFLPKIAIEEINAMYTYDAPYSMSLILKDDTWYIEKVICLAEGKSDDLGVFAATHGYGDYKAFS